MNLVDLSIKRPVMISMGLTACVIFGLMAYFSINLSLLPNVPVPYVTIQTTYPGASPQVIETQITKKIEDQVSSIGDLDTVTSYSMDSVSLVLVAFKYGKDENIAVQEVKDKVAVISSGFPADAKDPAISKVDLSSMMPVMNIILEGDLTPTELYTFGSTTVSDRLSQVSGVGSIVLSGGARREIRVNLDRSTVYERSIPVTQISGILAAANVEIPGGNFQYAGQDIPVRLKGEFSSLDEIRNLDVPTQTGLFKLRQLADVTDTTSVVRERTVFLDKKSGIRNDNAILLQVVKNPSANTVSVVRNIMKQIPEMEKMSGGNAHLRVIKEDATYVRDSVNDTLSNVYLGILFTGLVLLFFLHDLRSTAIIAVAMPFSIVSTFLVLKMMGISLNMMSLMGLSCSTGTLVANSVVVLENIFRYKEMGHSRLESASKGTREVVVAVFASTLTNIAVFVPLANMSGMMGAMLADFAWAIVIATVFSILVSFTLTPMMASRILPEQAKKDGKIGQALESLFKNWETHYRRWLSAVLQTRRRSAVVVASTVAVFIVSMAAFTTGKFELMPLTDGGKIMINVELPQGNDLRATASVLETIEQRLAGYSEIETVVTSLGSRGITNKDVSVAQMNAFLAPKAERKLGNAELAVRMTRTLSDIPGVTIRVSPVSELVVGGKSSPVDLYLKGESTELLKKYAEEIQGRIIAIPGITNVSLSSKSGKMELVFDPDRKQISEDGLSVQAIAVTLRSSVDGIVSSTFTENSVEYDIRVGIAGDSLRDIGDIRNIPVVSAAGVHPLSRYAKVSFAEGSNKIMRNDKIRTVEITADLLPGYTAGNVGNTVMAEIDRMELPAGYTVQKAGNSQMLGDTVRDLLMVFVIACLLIYMLLAATLESLTQPLFILSTVPLSLIGVVIFCLASGTVLNIVAMLGIIMLIGIVVNNAILILDYYNQLKKEGRSTKESLLEACPTKLKAILMSNVAIVLGMLPMAMGIGASGAEMRQPMGLVIIGGIVSSTALTLFIIPALEFIFDRPRGSTTMVKES